MAVETVDEVVSVEGPPRKKTWINSVLAVIGKSPKLLKAYKLLKLFKFTKALVALATMSFSLLVYSLAWGPWFGIGFVAVLFIHEMGHIVAIRSRGLETPGPVFIPMVGAIIFAPNARSAQDEAIIGYGGPAAGLAISAAVFLLALGYHSQLLFLIAYFSTFLNLFNLLPIRPLDGGRVMQIAGKWSRYFGIAALVGLTALMREPGVLYVWIICLQDIGMNGKLRFGTGIVLWVAMATLMLLGFSHQPLFADCLDCVLSAFIITMYWSLLNEKELEPKWPPAPMSMRLKWILLYLSLSVALVGLFFAVIPHLPHLPGAHR